MDISDLQSGIIPNVLIPSSIGDQASCHLCDIS